MNPALGHEGCLWHSKGDDLGSLPERQADPQAILPVIFLETTFGWA